jgi:hypothetical protein
MIEAWDVMMMVHKEYGIWNSKCESLERRTVEPFRTVIRFYTAYVFHANRREDGRI